MGSDNLHRAKTSAFQDKVNLYVDYLINCYQAAIKAEKEKADEKKVALKRLNRAFSTQPTPTSLQGELTLWVT